MFSQVYCCFAVQVFHLRVSLYGDGSQQSLMCASGADSLLERKKIRLKNKGNSTTEQKLILSLDRILGSVQNKQASKSNGTERLFISGPKFDI